MPVGLVSYASNGSVQIDETHYCLSLKVKGTATATLTHPASSIDSSNDIRYVDISYASEDAPVFAIRIAEASPVMSAGVIAVTKSGNNWTFRVCVTGAKSQTFTFNYYIYDRPDWISSPGSGIALRDANLKPIFNSNNPVMIVRGQQSGDYGVGRTYAFACTAVIRLFHEIVDNTPNGFLTLESVEFDGAYCTSTGVQRVVKTVWGNVSGGPNPPSLSPGAGLDGWGGGGVNPAISYDDAVFSVIDVTNQ